MIYWVQAAVLLTIILQPSEQACLEGWFGRKCTLQCHCPPNVKCDVNGSCGFKRECLSPYFGEGCQYIDLVSTDIDIKTPLYLRDRNRTTCNQHRLSTSVEIWLTVSMPFSWFRIVIKDAWFLRNFTTILNHQTPCNNERKFKVDYYTVDVTCDTHIPIYKVRIEGITAAHVCSVYISMGRNVAFKQLTTQSSTYNNDVAKYGPQNAVDGNPDPEMNENSCSCTDAKSSVGWWRVTFAFPVVIHFAIITNRNEQHFRLDDFQFTTFLQPGIVDSYYIGGRNIVVQTLHAASGNPVVYVVIVQATRTPVHERYLTLCEVEIYGDNVCPNNYYGLECSDRCSCNRVEVCNGLTGACDLGCPPGFYGYTCVSRCSNKCLDSICDFYTGNCLDCIPGYTGIRCENECEYYQYGKGCAFTCSVGCLRRCNFTNGHCDCSSNFKGLQCHACQDGKYGPSCHLNCQRNCATCDHLYGDCIKCSNATSGERCNECTDGLYGTLCNNTCPKNCLDGKCEMQTGNCLKCKIGFTGIICNKSNTELIGCPDYYYGSFCNLTCPTNCLNGSCDIVNGTCDNCTYHFIGDNCDECPENMHGHGCSLECSSNCLDKKCDMESGKCSKCQIGYSGDRCEVKNTMMPYWVIFCSMLLSVFIVSMYLQRRKEVATKGYEHEDVRTVKKRREN